MRGADALTPRANVTRELWPSLWRRDDVSDTSFVGMPCYCKQYVNEYDLYVVRCLRCVPMHHAQMRRISDQRLVEYSFEKCELCVFVLFCRGGCRCVALLGLTSTGNNARKHTRQLPGAVTVQWLERTDTVWAGDGIYRCYLLTRWHSCRSEEGRAIKIAWFVGCSQFMQSIFLEHRRPKASSLRQLPTPPEFAKDYVICCF